MRILVVDDSTINNIMLENILSSYGYETYSILESESVMKNIDSYKPDLILLDLMMPGMSGFDILKQMQKQSINIPTIVITAFNDTGYAKRAKELGATAYITKPLDHEKLINTIKEATS